MKQITRIERLEARCQALEEALATLLQAVEQEDKDDEQQAELTLDGQGAGGERDQDQPL